MWEARSPSDPAPGLKFKSEEEANNHALRMNSLLSSFDTDQGWNRDYWKTLPKEWVVKKL